MHKDEGKCTGMGQEGGRNMEKTTNPQLATCNSQPQPMLPVVGLCQEDPKKYPNVPGLYRFCPGFWGVPCSGVPS
jgi:hypothetical protein